jgi:hypothetical protein
MTMAWVVDRRRGSVDPDGTLHYRQTLLADLAPEIALAARLATVTAAAIEVEETRRGSLSAYKAATDGLARTVIEVGYASAEIARIATQAIAA